MSTDLKRLQARLDRVESHLGLRPAYPAPGSPFYGLTPGSGLHHLKDKWCQVENMVEQCRWLREELALAIEATRLLSPQRTTTQGFKLQDRIEQPRPKNVPERQLEWDIYRRWSLFHNTSLPPQVMWQGLIGFQVPLYDRLRKDGWDKIDLFGVCPAGEPVVVELKRDRSDEKPLRPLLEAAAYAIALRTVWHTFHAELTALLGRLNIDLVVQAHPQRIHVVVLAPSNYWSYLHSTKELTPALWNEFDLLVAEFSKHGLLIKFASVTTPPSSQDWAVVPVERFPSVGPATEA